VAVGPVRRIKLAASRSPCGGAASTERRLSAAIPSVSMSLPTGGPVGGDGL
jgi:hypothetical protein